MSITAKPAACGMPHIRKREKIIHGQNLNTVCKCVVSSNADRDRHILRKMTLKKWPHKKVII